MIQALLLAAAIGSQVITGPAHVVDADTLRIDDIRIRLFGIDAPEAGEECVDTAAAVWRCGTRATEALRARVAGKTIACEPVDTDRYGRTVAICREGGEDLQQWLVRNGWAKAYPRFSRRYVPDEAAARRDRMGLWR